MNVMENEKEMIDEIEETKLEENYVNSEKDSKITCKENLTPYFKAWDHSINRVHLSDVCIYKKEQYVLFTLRASIFLSFISIIIFLRS